jgi:GTPase SAR1 family protein
MQQSIIVYILGTAGCGKSTFTAAAANKLNEMGFSVQTVNLDPGADALPYEPGVDVRDWLTLGDVMEEYGLGPNGAQVVAADMVALYKKKVIEELAIGETQYILIDTPGQLELFSFRESAREIVHGILPENSYLLYLIDPFNARTPSGYISQVMLANLSKLRFQIPTIEVISKGDMIQPDLMKQIQRWQDFPDHLLDDAQEEASEKGSMSNELAIGLFRSMEELGLLTSHEIVSAKNGDGIENIYQTIQLTFGGGEDLEKAG